MVRNMKTILYRRYGPPEVLEYTEVPIPEIKDNQILVRVHAAAVNPVDWKLRSGRYRFPWQRLPRIPGSDIAGEIVEVGKGVNRFKPGDYVYAMLSPFSGGGCAEYASVPVQNAALKPGNLSFTEAAAVPVVGLTALQALRDRGKIKKGYHVLINGASSGVGSFAVQIANAFGAEVTGVTSQRNLDFVKGLGADKVIDYTVEDFTGRDTHYDIIFDTVASRSFSECRHLLNPKGIYITTLPGLSTITQILIGAITRGKRAGFVFVNPNPADLETLTKWIEERKVRPHIDRIYSLPQTAEAHAYSESGHVRGKIVISIDE
jgi:NADPH:quinone reductase-like Zn-dependent oxidoreductase